jgi:hypothetical protein
MTLRRINAAALYPDVPYDYAAVAPVARRCRRARRVCRSPIRPCSAMGR